MARIGRSEDEKKLDEQIGKRLARIRKERGFTQLELAEKTGINQPNLSDYERGKLRPHPRTLIQLATALQVSSDEILGLEQQPKKAGPLNRRLLRRLQAMDVLPKRDQEALLRTIDAFLSARKAS